jgi:excisionase family DNA binding protein
MSPETGFTDQLLTLQEGASMLRLKVSTLRAWILHRKIAYVKLGGRVFLRKGDCEALIATSLVPAREDRRAR